MSIPRSGALALGLLLTFTACGGGGDDDTATATGDTAASSESSEGDTAYQDCLAEQGVELPDFGGGEGGPPEGFDPESGSIPPGGGGQGGLPEGVDQEALQEAMEACADLAPEGGFGGGPGGAGLEALEAYRSCLADNGVEVPESTEGSPPASIDETDPDFAAANEVCAALLPEQGEGASTTTTSEG